MPNPDWKSSLLILESVSSTNSYLKELSVHESLEEGLVVFAHEQIQGRGEGANTWYSQAGKNLILSVFLRPTQISVTRQFDLNMVVALALCDYLAEKEINAKVKWPNDIMVNDSKIAGILIENSLKKGSIEASILGFGLNLNQTHFPKCNYLPTSVFLLKGREYDTKKELYRLVDILQKAYISLNFQRSSRIRQQYMKRLYALNEVRLFRQGENTFYGQIVGVKPSGRLVIKKSDGSSESYGYKEVQLLKRD